MKKFRVLGLWQKSLSSASVAQWIARAKKELIARAGPQYLKVGGLLPTEDF
jgi:hypothetical protein